MTLHWHHVAMAPVGITHVLFDFFGTLVDYAPGGASSAEDCAALVRSYGADLDGSRFTTLWDATFEVFESRAGIDRREFSMDELARAFLAPLLGREPSTVEARALASTYVREWNDGVRYRPDTPAILATLSARFRLAIVSNTHESDLVGAHMETMGIAGRFDEVITSVDFGWRKPHPAIYAEALDRLGIDAARAVFVGDTYGADFEGPEAYGIRAYLIDPFRTHDIPDDQRLSSLADLPKRL